MEVSMSKTRRGKYTDNRICYISKCKGDMRLYFRRKGKLPCFSYLVRGKSFSFYRGKIKKKSEKTNECIRKFYFSLLFPRYPLFFPRFSLLCFRVAGKSWKRGLLFCIFALSIRNRTAMWQNPFTLHPLLVSCCVIGCYVINYSKSPFTTLHRPSS